MRRAAVATAIALVAAIAAATPVFPTHPEPPGRCAQTFCAGAARADITPPVTTPMWGYTARHVGLGLGSHLERAVGDLASGDPEAAVDEIASDAWLRNRAGGDVEGYCKTFECNQGIHTRLFANAFVVRDAAGSKLAVVQVDLGGLPGEVHEAVANRVVHRTGIDRAHLLISATHTHHGPGGIFQYQGYALLGGDEFDPRVYEAVVGGIARAVLRADAGLVPARLGWGQSPLEGANRNRRVSAQWCLNPEVSCTDGSWDGTGPPPANDELTVIRVDTRDGRPLGAIVNFAAHGTIGGDDNLLFSGDNQAFAVRQAERAIRETWEASCGPCGLRAGLPVVALVNGAQGDQSPVGDAGAAWEGLDATHRSYAEMEGAGRLQAPGIAALWASLGSELSEDVTLDARFEFICFCGQPVADPRANFDGDPLWDRVSPVAVLGAGGVTLPDGTQSPVVFPTQGRKLPALAGVGAVPNITRLGVMRIGDLLVLGVPGEPTVQVGRRLTARALVAAGEAEPGVVRGAFVAGLANDYASYMSTQEEYRGHAYEGSFSLYGPQQGQLLIERHERLAAALAAGTAVAECEGGLTCPAPHPDTTAASVRPLPLVPDVTGEVVANPPEDAARFETVSFSWTGGSPSAEWAPDEPRVVIERLRADLAWEPVGDDTRGVATLLRYRKEPTRHVWTAAWDISRDQAPAVYRIRGRGHTTVAPGRRAPYAVVSDPLEVSPSSSLTATASGNLVRIAYPAPDPEASFRFRGVPDGGHVDAFVGGACVSAPIGPDGTAVFGGPVESVVAAVDQFGNSTGAGLCV